MPYNSSGREIYGELQDQTVISYAEKADIPHDIIKIAQEYKKKLTKPQDIVDFQVLVANRDRGELNVESMNIRLQKVFNDMKKPFIKHFVYEYRTDDKIIHKGNSYDTPIYRSIGDYRAYKNHSPKSLFNEGLISMEDVFNGTMGIIISLEKGGKGEDVIIAEFEGIEGYVAISKNNLDSIRMAYTLSIHESQGSGIRHIIFALDYGAFSLLSRQLAYTAITRAIEKGVVLCENNALYTAISKDASGDRRTFLGDFMSIN